ncbi:MAG: hypothetical protein LBP26_01930 [Clostridiales bacterium]|jgi:nitrate/nitrite transporter NarK|nr:hypothetical protein [Clostridiales bacterium]
MKKFLENLAVNTAGLIIVVSVLVFALDGAHTARKFIFAVGAFLFLNICYYGAKALIIRKPTKTKNQTDGGKGETK